MRYLHLFALVLSAGPINAQTPRFVVENKTSPGFVVVNKTAPAKPGRYDPYGFTDYAKFLDQVKRLGKTGMCVLVVGIEDKYIGTYQCHCRVSSGFGGFEDGEYDCWYENGNAMMQLRKEVKPAANPFPRPATTPSTRQGTLVPSVVGFPTSRPGAAQYAVPTYTLTDFTGGITWTSNCPPSG